MEMAVASRYQVPRSRVLGRPARARTVYFYDEQGRLTHSETVWEPEWDEDDFDWAVGHMAEDADKCPGGCGQYLSETTDPAAEGRYEASALRCHACTPLEAEKAKWANAPDGLLFDVRRRS